MHGLVLRNLSQIGFGLSLYDQMHGHLPETGTMPPGVPPIKGPAGPLKELLESAGAVAA